MEFDTSKAYELYLKIYPNGCSKENFDKSIVRTTGYTIDEKGCTLSLTKMVNTFLSNSFSQFGECFIEPVKLDYVESQMLSHANGYMWFANTGAWADVFNLFKATDLIVIEILSKVQNVFELHREIEESKKQTEEYYNNQLIANQKSLEDLKKNKKNYSDEEYNALVSHYEGLISLAIPIMIMNVMQSIFTIIDIIISTIYSHH